ncbi:MAG: hypothetical protein R3F39_13500 [Myxococcota bacterium]
MNRLWQAVVACASVGCVAFAACESPGSGAGPVADASGAFDSVSDSSADGAFDGGADAVGDAVPDGSLDAAPDAGPLPSLRVDPQCIDGQFSETLPNTTADLSASIASYSAADPQSFILAVLDARYPAGASIVRKGLAAESSGFGNCIASFMGASHSAQALFPQLSTFVHECGHFADLAESFGGTFIFNESTVVRCQGGGSQGGAPRTFARSLINQDDYAALRPPCGAGGSSGCDFYAKVYLDGDPSDATFQGGDQGFDSVIEETTQYIGSLATGYSFADYYSAKTSERDGILTFLWYLERYLRLARLEHPTVHAALLQNACWRRAVLTAWGRAHLYLEATEGVAVLGLEDAELDALVADPELLSEIQRVRDAEGCGAP